MWPIPCQCMPRTRPCLQRLQRMPSTSLQIASQWGCLAPQDFYVNFWAFPHLGPVLVSVLQFFRSTPTKNSFCFTCKIEMKLEPEDVAVQPDPLLRPLQAGDVWSFFFIVALTKDPRFQFPYGTKRWIVHQVPPSLKKRRTLTIPISSRNLRRLPEPLTIPI